MPRCCRHAVAAAALPPPPHHCQTAATIALSVATVLPPPPRCCHGIFLSNDDSKLHDAIKEIQDLGLNIEDQGHPADYVGVNIKTL
jgi:hypothetical protein